MAKNKSLVIKVAISVFFKWETNMEIPAATEVNKPPTSDRTANKTAPKLLPFSVAVVTYRLLSSSRRKVMRA